MTESSAETLIEQLLNPAIYPHPCRQVEVIETHISWVLLTGVRAYKIKKAVDLGFVDFTSLEQRAHYCNEELRLNRRLAPDMYLDVVSITGSRARPEIGGSGEAIEYAVCMRQFDQSHLMSHMLERSEVTVAHIDQLAEAIAVFHGEIATADPTTELGSPEAVTQPVRANFEGFGSDLPKTAQSLALELKVWSDRMADRLHSVFIERQDEGMIRECHGDMHLGNMFFSGHSLTIFDGIEFSDSLRWIDVMSEVAFLVMDLEDRGRPDLAHRFLDQWLEHTNDYSGLRVLPFYLTYRAVVRAKVDAIRLRQGHLDRAAARHLSDDCLGYLKLAHGYAKPRRAALMITNGLSGSGKTTGTQDIVEQFGAIRIRSDVERKRLHGLGRSEASDGSIYSQADTDRTYERLAELAALIVAAGFPVIVDATFLLQHQRARFRKLADRLNVPFCILRFDADADVLRERVVARQKHESDASEAGLEVLEQQLRISEALQPDEAALPFGRILVWNHWFGALNNDSGSRP